MRDTRSPSQFSQRRGLRATFKALGTEREEPGTHPVEITGHHELPRHDKWLEEGQRDLKASSSEEALVGTTATDTFGSESWISLLHGTAETLISHCRNICLHPRHTPGRGGGSEEAGREGTSSYPRGVTCRVWGDCRSDRLP